MSDSPDENEPVTAFDLLWEQWIRLGLSPDSELQFRLRTGTRLVRFILGEEEFLRDIDVSIEGLKALGDGAGIASTWEALHALAEPPA